MFAKCKKGTKYVPIKEQKELIRCGVLDEQLKPRITSYGNTQPTDVDESMKQDKTNTVNTSQNGINQYELQYLLPSLHVSFINRIKIRFSKKKDKTS